MSLDAAPSDLLVDHAGLLHGTIDQPVLDLACGDGRNGLWLAARGVPVVFADRDREKLDAIATVMPPGCRILSVDLEAARGPDVLAGQRFSAVLVFRYLHRPLVPLLRDLVVPGGFIIYETFTVDQPRYGRPKRPEFLLEKGELRRWFAGWEEIHWFEGVRRQPVPAAIARLVCRRPL